MKIKILCTLGPSSFSPDVIRGLDERGVHLLRINLSHTAPEALEETIASVRAVSSTPICLDTQGAQVRCGRIQADVTLQEGAEVRLTDQPVTGDEREIPLWPGTVFEALAPGSKVSLDFDGAMLQIIAVEPGSARATVVSPGRVRSNKAVTVDPPLALPALTEQDEAAIRIGAAHGITHYALSFAASAANVARIRELAPAGAHIMSKIESRAGVRNMDEIIEASDSVLIDRGDLSREVPLEYVPYYQKAVVRRANRGNRPVYVATNLLESMVSNRQPTVAEVNDIANTLLDGVHGLVLAAETAVGLDPVGSVDIVLRAIEAFERTSEGHLLAEDRVFSTRAS
ncbi:MAG: pyruvate kinase [Gaiellaceae bacterium]|jgi:pyruvate kinase